MDMIKEVEQAAADAQYEEHLIKSGDLSHMGADERYVYQQLQYGHSLKQAIGQLEALKDEQDFQNKVLFAIKLNKEIQTYIQKLTVMENEN